MKDHPIPDTVRVALDKLGKADKMSSHYVFLSGFGVSGNLILRSNVHKYDTNALKKEVKAAMDISEEAKVKLIQTNRYSQPNLIHETFFGEDVEGYNFFMLEDPKDKITSQKL